jgi:Domain of unknown function (DUF222)
MDSNTHSTQPPGQPPGGQSDWLAALAVVADGLATQDLDRLPDAVVAAQVLELRRLLDRLEGHWLHQLAAVDGRGAAGAEAGQEVGSTAAWLRNRLRLGTGAASSAVRTARALFRGPLTETAQALTGGELSVAHAQVLASGTHDLPDHVTVEAEPVLVEAATCSNSPTPTARSGTGSAAMPAAACGWPQPLRAWSRWMGCWSPRPARPSWLPWNPWPAPATPRMPAAAANARPMP